MNLVTASVVETSVELARQDREGQRQWQKKKREQIVAKVSEMFTVMDKDGSGELELEELMQAPDEIQDELAEIFGEGDLSELFNILDCDGSGKIQLEELCESMLHADKGKPRELLQMVACGRQTLRTLKDTVVPSLEELRCLT